MNKLYAFEPFGTMPMTRGFIDDPSPTRIRSGWNRLHSIPEMYPKQEQVRRTITDFYNDVRANFKPKVVLHGDNSANFDIDQQLRFNAMQETVNATQYINKSMATRDFTNEDVQRRISQLPNNEEVAKAIQVFENKLQTVMLSPEKKKELRDAFYKDIFTASTEAIFKIAKDEKNKDVNEILNIVRNLNIDDDNADLDKRPPQFDDLGGAMAGDAFDVPPMAPPMPPPLPEEEGDEKFPEPEVRPEDLPDIPDFEVGDKFIIKPNLDKFNPYTTKFKPPQQETQEKALKDKFMKKSWSYIRTVQRRNKKGKIITEKEKVGVPALTKEELLYAIYFAIGYGYKAGRPSDSVKIASKIIKTKASYKGYLNFVKRVIEFEYAEARKLGKQLPKTPVGFVGDKVYIDGVEDPELTRQLAVLEADE